MRFLTGYGAYQNQGRVLSSALTGLACIQAEAVTEDDYYSHTAGLPVLGNGRSELKWDHILPTPSQALVQICSSISLMIDNAVGDYPWSGLYFPLNGQCRQDGVDTEASCLDCILYILGLLCGWNSVQLQLL